MFSTKNSPKKIRKYHILKRISTATGDGDISVAADSLFILESCNPNKICQGDEYNFNFKVTITSHYDNTTL